MDPIRYPNISGNFQQGYAFGNQIKQQREQEQDRYALRNLAPKVIDGDLDAMAQATAIDADTAAKYDAVGVNMATRAAGAANYVLDAVKRENPKEIQARWMNVIPFMTRFAAQHGKPPPPDQFDPAAVPLMEQLVARAKGMGEQQRNLALSPGSAIVNPDSGQVVYERPYAPAKDNWQVENVPDGSGGTVQMERNPATGDWRKPSYGPSPTRGSQPAPQPGAPQGGQLNPSQDFAALSQEFGIRPSSLLRTPERNADVGGVANSYHLTGEAADYPVPPQMKAQFMARAQAMGYQAIDEGDHIHLEPPRRGATAQPSSAGGAGMGYTPPKAGGEQFRTLSPQEIAELGLPQGTIAQRSPTGQVQIINKPRDLPTGGQVIDNGDGTSTYIPAGKISEGERNAAGFYQRMEAANKEMERLTQTGYDPTNRRDFYTAGGDILNPLASSEGQQYRQAQENWVRANLRKESGAAIGVTEMDQERKNYFPIPGDSPEVIAQKARTREVTERAMRQAAGGGLAPPGQASGPVASGAPRPGTVEDGYRFKGGNPADPTSWERL